MTMTQLYVVTVGILAMIVLAAALIRLRQRRRAQRRGEHLVVRMAKKETLGDASLPEGQPMDPRH